MANTETHAHLAPTPHAGGIRTHDLAHEFLHRSMPSTGSTASSNGDGFGSPEVRPLTTSGTWRRSAGLSADSDRTAPNVDQETADGRSQFADEGVASPATGVANHATYARRHVGVESRSAMSDPPNALEQRKAARARELRERAGLSQRKLADLAGIERVDYNKMENAKRTITDETVLKLAAALGIDPGEYFVEPPSSNGHGHA